MSNTDGAFSQSAGVTLDASQRAVCELPEGVIASVIGAPGSGKTVTVSELVAERIQQRSYAAEEILVVTPTRISATRLRDQLARRIGQTTRGPLARTLNSFAFDLLCQQAALSGEHPPVLLTGAEQDRIIAELLAGQSANDTHSLWPETVPREVRSLRGFRTELRELMMRATDAGMSPAILADLGRRHHIPQWVAAGSFMGEYQSVIDRFGSWQCDSAELLAKARVLLSTHEGLLRGIRLVVVDDFQEFSSGSLNLLTTIAQQGASLIAFGDPDVSTAAFRGVQKTALAQLHALLAPKSSPGAAHKSRAVELLYLSTVYRHSSELRTLVTRSASRIGSAAAGRQRAAQADHTIRLDHDPTLKAIPAVRVVRATSLSDEITQVAGLLREHHLIRGIPWSEMAVVVRSGSLVSAFSSGLAARELSTTTSVGSSPLRENYAVKHLVSVLDFALNSLPEDNEVIRELLLGPFCGLNAVSLRRLRLALRHQELAGGGNRSADELLREVLSVPDALATINFSPARHVERLAKTVAAVREAHAANSSVEELLWIIWEASGLSELWYEKSQRSGIVADEAHRNLDGVLSLFTAAARFVQREPGRSAVDFLRAVRDSDIPEDSLSAQSRRAAVRVTTPSGVIGSEYEIVVVAHVQESIWPNMRLRGSVLQLQHLESLAATGEKNPFDERADVLADELRMFTLAVSRARSQTVLTAVQNDEEQPSPFLRLSPHSSDSVPTEPFSGPFSLRTLVGTLRRSLVNTGDAEAAAALAHLSVEGVVGAHPHSWYGMSERSTEEPLVNLDDPETCVTVSPSKLETYEKSPLAWFIDTVSAGSSSVSSGMGTVLHALLEEVSAEPDSDISVPALWSAVEKRLAELPHESAWLAQRETIKARRRIEGLANYLTDCRDSAVRVLHSEAEFSIRVGKALLRGTVDRIEQSPDGRIAVIDLKTGHSAPSAGELPQHAQLGSYQLALCAGAFDVAIGNETEAAVAQSNAGAALLYIALSSGRGSHKKLYKVQWQQPFDDTEIASFHQRIHQAAVGMAAASFPGNFSRNEHDLYAAYRYRLQLVKAVSE